MTEGATKETVRTPDEEREVLLLGAPVASALAEKIREDMHLLKTRGVEPCLAILRVGERGEQLTYERAATKRCTALGIQVRSVALPANTSQETLLSAVRALNADAQVHGILPLLPLPEALNTATFCHTLVPEKDVDGVAPASRAALYMGEPCFAPCTAEACMELLRAYQIDVAGKHAVVVGRSVVTGRAIAMLLLAENATVTVCHSRTRELAALCREADILVAAAGQRGLITAQHVRAGQTVLDVGIHVGEDGALCGDVDFAAVVPLAAAITPVPGGVGAVTNTVLAAHVAAAAMAQNGLEKIFEKNEKKC